MIAETPGLMEAVRGRFAHVDECPFTGPRIFFENAGGALTLNAVVESSARFAAIPDNQGRDNPASAALMAVIDKGKADMRLLMNAADGEVFVGESGTEVLFRLIRTAALAAPEGGEILGSTLEHPASRSAAARWSEVTGRHHVLVAHDDATGRVGPEAYAEKVTPATRVATIVHTSPVTGMTVDLPGIVAAIRAVSPDCLIVVDGIQHASHGAIDVAAQPIDGYAISPYKVFSRHGYGVGWASERLTAAAKEQIVGGSARAWELGTRDTGAYATFSDVVEYFRWLGRAVAGPAEPRAEIEAAARAIHAHEARLTQAMLHGTGNLRGLTELPGVGIIGGEGNAAREGLVSLTVAHVPAEEVVRRLGEEGVRVHIRKADHYSGNILEPLGIEACTRVSLCHYNTEAEVARFLAAMAAIAGDAA